MQRIYRVISLPLLLPALAFCTVAAQAPAHAPRSETVRVALFAPFAVGEIVVKATNADVSVRYPDGARETVCIKKELEFRLSAKGVGLQIEGLSLRRFGGPAQTIQLAAAEPDPSAIEIRAAHLGPQRFKGRIEITAAQGRLRLIESTHWEDYVAGVVYAEAGESRSPEALKAQAIVSRTFALRHGQRHAADGYDLCSSTHCQVYRGRAEPSHPAASAAADTAGGVMRQDGQLIEAYYSANCGGQTATAGEIWPDDPRESHAGVRDDYCHSSPHSAWRFRMDKASVCHALRADPRTDPGRFVQQLRITRRGESGRAVRLVIEGERRKVVSGWQFRQALCKAFGWASVKSTLFRVTSDGKDFLIEGQGLGHGVGLCQTGAEAMARRGMTAASILRYYFPQARLSSARPAQAERQGADIHSGAVPLRALRVAFAEPKIQARSSEHFLVKFFVSGEADEIERLLDWLEDMRAGYIERTGRAPDRPVEIILHPTTAAFIKSTGKPWWVAAATGDAIEMQPLRTLKTRGILQSTLRHEYAHLLIRATRTSPPPLWLEEGFALHLAGEGERLRPAGQKTEAVSDSALEAMLRKPSGRDEMQTAYYLAYQKVKKIIARDGEVAVWRRVK